MIPKAHRAFTSCNLFHRQINSLVGQTVQLRQNNVQNLTLFEHLAGLYHVQDDAHSFIRVQTTLTTLFHVRTHVKSAGVKS